MSVVFSDYLAAKFPLDERSLNREVREQLTPLLTRGKALDCLDLGTGSGAMLMRLLETATGALRLTGLDSQVELLTLAHTRLQPKLAMRHLPCQLTWVASSLAAFQAPPASFDLITAHAFLDIVPLAPTAERLHYWLKPGGLVYATLNYDGSTTLFPEYADPAFEARLLAQYDASMEQRRVDGLATGGIRSGLRLHRILLQQAFQIVAYGSSDWNITPLRGAYRDQDARVLQALLGFMRDEAAAASLAPESLQRWYSARLAQVEAGKLGLVIHQLDILAEKA